MRGLTLRDPAFLAGLTEAGGDPYASRNRLLLPMTGANNSTIFLDLSPVGHEVTANGNAKISTNQNIFSDSSGYFDGASWLTIPANSAFTFFEGYTLDGWLYLPATPTGSYAAIFDSRNTDFGDTGLLLAVDSSRRLKLFGGPNADLVSPANAIPLNTWVHFAVSKTGETLGLYAAGSELVTQNDFNNKTQNGPVYIGRVRDGVHPAFFGYLSYLRLTDVGRYSGNYTVPTEYSY